MALKRNETYPGRFSNPTDDHPQGAFKNRSAPGAQDGSYLEQGWANDWDGFFGRLLTIAGVTPNGSVDTASSSQYYDALKSLFLQRTDPFGDIKSDGAAAVKKALENLSLGEGSALPVGAPVPWPLATPPAGWLKCNGSPFSLESYPALAAVFPSGTLPDLRGEFIRGWDDGRGINAGRTLLSAEGSMTGHHSHGLMMAYNTATDQKNVLGTSPNYDKIAIKNMSTSSTGTKVTNFVGDGSMYMVDDATTGSETRPRNIAFNYIVRAA